MASKESWQQKKQRIEAGSRVEARSKAKYGNVRGKVRVAHAKNKWLIDWDDGNTERCARVFTSRELKKIEETPIEEPRDRGGRRQPTRNRSEQTQASSNEEARIEHSSNKELTRQSRRGAPSLTSDSESNNDDDDFPYGEELGEDEGWDDEEHKDDGDDDEEESVEEEESDDDEDGGASQCTDDGSEDGQDKYEKYRREKAALIGDTIEKKTGGQVYEWEIVEDVTPSKPFEEYEYIGLRGFDNFESENVYSDAFFHLYPIKLNEQLNNMNAWISLKNQEAKMKKIKPMRYVTQRELAMYIGILLASAGYSENGADMWDTAKGLKYEQEPPPPNLYDKTGMSRTRFNEIKPYFTKLFMRPDEYDKNDAWGPARPAIAKFNGNREKVIAASRRKCIDESMSGIQPRASKTGTLPNIHRNPDKPKSLGTENNTTACGEIGAIVHIDLNEGATGNTDKEFNDQLGKAAGLTACMVSGSSGCGQPEEEDNHDWYCADAKFTLLRSISWLAENGYEGILNLKQYHHGFPKAEFTAYLSGWPRGSYLVATCTLPNNKRVGFIAYKWNYKKTFYFAFTENAGSTVPKSDYSYIAQFNDDFGNVRSVILSRPEVVGLYYKYSNRVDVHNQFRQGYLALEECWVTTDGFFREITTLVGMCITDAFLSLKHHLGDNDPIHKMKIGNYCRAIVYQIFNTRYWRDEVRPLRPGAPLIGKEVVVDGSAGRSSDVSTLSGSSSQNGVIVGVPDDFPMVAESYRARHRMCETSETETDNVTTGKPRSKHMPCEICNRKTSYYCGGCGRDVWYCKDGQGRKGLRRYCFYKHVCQRYKNSGEATDEWKQDYEDFLCELAE